MTTDGRPAAPGLVDDEPAPWAVVEPVRDHAAEPRWTSAPGGPPSSRTREPGVLLRTAAAVLAVVSLACALVVVVGPHLVSTGSAYRATVPAAAGPSATPSQAPAPGPDAEIAELLDRRAHAVLGEDASAYAATQTRGARAPVFARLAALPLTVWDYRQVTTLDAQADRMQLDVRLHLRLDADASDAVVHEHVTVVRGTDGWRVSAESTADRRAQPWDLGAITVVRGTRSLVVGVDTPASVLRGYARLADSAVPEVTQVWGSAWSRRPVLVVPRTTAQLARALGRTTASLDGYAAVTTGELSDESGPASAALRVWLNPAGMSPLSAVGREVVVRHEITHVATDAPETPGVPLWLEEGFAEYVGYRGSGIGLDDELRELVAAVRSGRAPRTLPTRATFDGPQVDLAYEGGDLACRVIADRYGEQALVEVYRRTAAGAGSGEANLDAALRAVTGSGTSALESAWRARMKTLGG